MKKNRTNASDPSDLSPEHLSQVSGGQGGPNPGMFTGVLRKNNPAALQNFYNSLHDPVGLGDVIEGAADHNAKQALGGLAGVVGVIPAVKGASTAVRVGLQAAKGAAKAYKATSGR